MGGSPKDGLRERHTPIVLAGPLTRSQQLDDGNTLFEYPGVLVYVRGGRVVDVRGSAD